MTLIEVLTTIVIAGMLISIGGLAVRHFWLVRSLDGSAENIVSQLRQSQQRVVSESYPLVYGARFDKGTDDWWAIRYDPANPGTGDDTCTTTERHNFEGQVTIKDVAFDADPYITGFCRAQLAAAADDGFVFFYPRGNATAGSITLRQHVLGRDEVIEVAGITGRVTRP